MAFCNHLQGKCGKTWETHTQGQLNDRDSLRSSTQVLQLVGLKATPGLPGQWGEANRNVALNLRSNPCLLFFRALDSKGPHVAKAPLAALPKTPPYLHFPPASGCGATQAADSCRDGGCCSGAVAGVGSAWGIPCSRWASWLRGGHLARSQISYPVERKHTLDLGREVSRLPRSPSLSSY